MHKFDCLSHHLHTPWLLPSRRDDDGASAVEYGLLVVLIAAVIVAAVAALGTTVLGNYESFAAAFPG